MRVIVDTPLGVGDPYHPQRLNRTIARLAATRALMKPDGFAHLVADREDRIKGSHRFLEDHRDAGAANRAHGSLVQLEQIDALELDRAACDARALWQQP